MKTFIRPTFNRILVKRSEMKDAEGNIIIPDGAKERPSEGIIVALGPGVRTTATERWVHAKWADALEAFELDPTVQLFELGQKVTFGTYAGKPMKANGEEFVLLQQEEIESELVEVEDGQ